MEGDKRQRSNARAIASVCQNTQSLESLLSRISMSNQTNAPFPQSQAFSPAGSGLPGSEVNFNHPSAVGRSPSHTGGVKVYEDKAIPGTHIPVMSSQPYSSQTPVMQAYAQQSYPTLPSSSDNNRFQGDKMSSSPIPFSTMTSGVGSCPSDPSTRLLRQLAQRSPCHSPVPVPVPVPMPSQACPSPTHLDSRLEANMAMSMKTAFSSQELHKATDGFSPQKILGEGGFGVVYHGQLRGMECAVKKFCKKKAEGKENSLDQVHSELSALLKYQHENIVTLYGYASDGPELCLVYQYLSNGSLEDRLMRKNNTPPLLWERRLNILTGSCKAVSFLHSMGSQPLIHGDIKSANILLDHHQEAKLADLGQSRYATSRSSTSTGSLTHITLAQTTQRHYGTVAFQSPEVKTGCSISVQSDVYAMGVVFLEVCSGLQAYDPNRHENKFLTDLYSQYVTRHSETDQRHMFQDKSPSDSLNPAVFQSLLKLAGRCVKDSKKNRPTSSKLLKGIKELYDNQYKVQFPPKCLNSPTEDDCTQLHTFTSEASPLNSTVSQVPSFVMMQEKRYQQISVQNSKHPSISASKADYIDSEIQGKVACDDGKSIPYHSSSVTPAQQSPSYLASFPPNHPRPEALLLQEHYDLLSGSLHSQEPLSSIKKPTEEGEEWLFVENESRLSSDPLKLANMQWFDKHGFKSVASTGHSDTSPVALESDPVKMKYLQTFDDEVFLVNKGLNNGCGNGSNPSVGNGNFRNCPLISGNPSENSNPVDRMSSNVNVGLQGEASSGRSHNGDNHSSQTGQYKFDSPAGSGGNQARLNSQETDIKNKPKGFLFNKGDMQQRLANREHMFLAYENYIAAEEANDARQGEEVEGQGQVSSAMLSPVFEGTTQDTTAYI